MRVHVHAAPKQAKITLLFRDAVTCAKLEESEDVISTKSGRGHPSGQGHTGSFWGAGNVSFLDLCGVTRVFAHECFFNCTCVIYLCSVMINLTLKREKI